jgi:8-amino-7-oxononanoate synthase
MGGEHARDLEQELALLADRQLRRIRRTVAGGHGPVVEVDGRRALSLASNNYLGLATDPRVVSAAIAALERSGASASASPLVCGHMSDHALLEADIADWLGCEAAVVFGSGYHANIGVLAALAQEGDEILSDELNHASLIDGCRLARAAVRVFPHRDTRALGRLLESSRARRRLIVTDSVFSMDGDTAPLGEIVELAERHGGWVMVDEAHATGVFGPSGAGLASELGLGARVTVRMGTLGKALGSYGAFVAGSRPLVELLVNRARAYVYSTALPPAVVAAARAAVAIACSDAARRDRLWRNARRLHAGLRAGGVAMGALESPILPLVVGAAEEALEVSRLALERGVFSPAVRPPTVPEGTARLRLTPIATHTDEQIDGAVEVLVATVRVSRSRISAPSASDGGAQAPDGGAEGTVRAGGA